MNNEEKYRIALRNIASLQDEQAMREEAERALGEYDLTNNPCPVTPQSESREANDLSIIMAYEAFRICVGKPTEYYPPARVFAWMNAMLNQ